MKLKEIYNQLFEERKLLYRTNRGELYEDGDIIIKITIDDIEYKNAEKLIKSPSKYFIKYHTAQKLENGKYELTMERITPLNDKQWEMVDLINNNLGVREYILDDNRRNRFIQELKQNPEFHEDFATFKEMLTMTLLIRRMYVEGDRRNLEIHDLRSQNLGVKNNGDIVHFDLGAG